MVAALALPVADYVIVGGGTAGLVLAARLSEVPSVSVAVLEAGADRSDDLNVLAPGLLTALYGDPTYDWIYETSPQPHVNDRVIGHPRGKQLGGCSAINYLAYTHASRQNIDDWGELGNHGWSWDELEPYFTKSEDFTDATGQVAKDLDTSYIDPSIHGTRGPIDNAFPYEYSRLDEAWPRAYDTLGIGVKSDPRDGLAMGGYTILTNLDLDGNTRSYAATAYLNPIRNRTNLHVYTNALVSKIIFDTACETPVATGVSLSINGTAYAINASSEVILSAGSFGSPQILEQSGIGSEKLLAKYGIPVVLDNPNIGENLQDHVYMPLGFDVAGGIFTLDDLADETIFNAAYDQYLANGTGPLSLVALGGALLTTEQILPPSDVKPFLHHISSLVKITHTSSATTRAQHALILRNMLRKGEIAQHMNTASGMNPVFANDTTKLFSAPTSGNYFTILGVLEHPFSRGSVHISSANATAYPTIDPNYLSHPADIKILAKIALHIQDVLAPAMGPVLTGALQPAYTRLTEENVESEIRRLLQSEYHPTGTCAMGEVVDAELRVKGVKGLRVVDASVFPLQPRANLQTLVYAVAERAAEWVRRDCGKW